MGYVGTLLIVEDLEKSLNFYQELLDEKIKFDFGANQQFESGLSLQTRESMIRLFGFREEEMLKNANNMELFYEIEPFDDFLERLYQHPDIEFVHGKNTPTTFDWGQRSIKFYDPDHYIIEVGESMDGVAIRMLESGMDIDEVFQATEMPVDYLKTLI